MIVLPVLDLLDGHVVHGKAGHRAEYRPIVSSLTSSSHPLDVARAIDDYFGLTTFYVADLDGILWQRPHLQVYRQLTDAGFSLIVDAGAIDSQNLDRIRETGVTRQIIGLESCPSPRTLEAIVNVQTDITFSVDLSNGRLKLSEHAEGWSSSPHEVIAQVVSQGVSSLVILDLADVGMGTGGSTDSLCRDALHGLPNVHLIAGGGVRGRDDLQRFEQIGVAEVLVASALHDGRLSPEDVIAFRT